MHLLSEFLERQRAKMLNKSDQETNSFFHPQDRFLTQSEGEIHSTKADSVRFTVAQQWADFSFLVPIGKNYLRGINLAAKFKGRGKIML